VSLILLRNLVVGLLAAATLLWSLIYNLKSKLPEVGRGSVWSVGPTEMVVPILAVILLAASFHALVRFWTDRNFVGIIGSIVMVAIMFGYTFKAAYEANAMIREGARQEAANKNGGGDRKAKREQEINEEIRSLRLQLDRNDTPASIEAEINKYLQDPRTEGCKPGTLWNGPVTKQICPIVGDLRIKKVKAQRVEDLMAERQKIWSAITKIEESKGDVDPRTKYVEILRVLAMGTSDERDQLNDADVVIAVSAIWESLAAELAAMAGPSLVIFLLGGFTPLPSPSIREPLSEPEIQDAPASDVPVVLVNPVFRRWSHERLEWGTEFGEGATSLQEDFKQWCRQNDLPLTGRWAQQFSADLKAIGLIWTKPKTVVYQGARLKSVSRELKVVK